MPAIAPISIVASSEALPEASLMIPIGEAQAMMQPSPEEEKKVLADAFIATLGLMAKLMPRYANVVGALPTQQIDLLVEEQRAPGLFWRLFFRGKTPPRTFTTQSTTAWEACDGAMRTIPTTVCIDIEDGKPYVWRHISHRGLAGYVRLTPDFLQGLTAGELKQFNNAAEDRYRLRDVELHDSLPDCYHVVSC